MDLRRQIGRRVRMLRESRAAPINSSGSKARRRDRMTIEQLAELAGLSVDYVNKLELGRYQPSAETLIRLANALQVDVAQLLPDGVAGPGVGKRQALDELLAFASQFSTAEIRRLRRVAEAVLDRNGARGHKD